MAIQQNRTFSNAPLPSSGEIPLAHPPQAAAAFSLPSITSLLPQDRGTLDFRRQSAPAGPKSVHIVENSPSMRSLSYPHPSMFPNPPATGGPLIVPMMYSGYPGTVPAQNAQNVVPHLHHQSRQSTAPPQNAPVGPGDSVQPQPAMTQVVVTPPPPPADKQAQPMLTTQLNGQPPEPQHVNYSAKPPSQPQPYYVAPGGTVPGMPPTAAPMGSSAPQQLHKAPGMIPQMPIPQSINPGQPMAPTVPTMMHVPGMMGGPSGPAAGMHPGSMPMPVMGMPMNVPAIMRGASVNRFPADRNMAQNHPYLNAAAAAAVANGQRAYMWAPTNISQSQPFTQEIKRRTKTGCLTCRKRRIKCDEKYPVCKNCSKSDRICLGYDPVFGVGKGSRTVNIRAQRQEFSQRHGVKSSDDKIDKEAAKVTEWSEVARLFAQHAAPQLDKLFGVQRFANITNEVLAQFERGESMHPRETRLAGELEVMRLFLAIVLPEHDFESLDVLDIVSGSLDKLRVAENYRLLRAVYDTFSLAGVKTLAVSPLDEQLVPRLQVLNRLIYALPAAQLRSPMQIDHVERAKSPVQAADLWPLLVEMAQGLSLSATQIDYICQLSQQPEAGIAEAMLLVGVLSAASPLNRPRVCHALLELRSKADTLSLTVIELALAYESK